MAASTGRQCTNFGKDGGRCTTHGKAARRTPAALTASVAVVQLDGAGWQSWKFGSRAWQIEAWRLYDITGPLRFVANWVGNSVSRCRLYVAEVNETGEPGDEAEDLNIAQLAGGLMGQGPAKDEALRLLGINLFVAGEAYIIAEADALEGGGDRWFIVSGRHISRSGNNVTIRRSQLDGGGEMHYREGIDLIIRVWTPHPNDTDEPDSSTRSAIPELRKIEAIGKREFAELDSRLAGAGLLLLPAGIDFPRGPDEAPGLEGFEQKLQRTMATSLQDRSSAEAMVPIAMTVAPDLVDKIKHLTFWSELSEHLIPLAEAAYRALGMSLDIPPEILLGQADSNHWCVDDQTQILTEGGWRSHDQLQPGDTVLTLNHETGLSEWEPVEDVRRWDVTDLEMVSVERRHHSSLTTPNHRWPVFQSGSGQWAPAWTTSGQLRRGRHRLISRAPCADTPTDAKWSDAFVELMAFFWTEGQCRWRPDRTRPQVSFSQSDTANPEHVTRIRAALTALYGPAYEGAGRIGSGRRRCDTPLWREYHYKGTVRFRLNWLAAEPFVGIAPNRIVPPDFIRQLTAAQLELFIQRSIDGDGHTRANGAQHITQKNPDALDAFELAVILSGRMPYRAKAVGCWKTSIVRKDGNVRPPARTIRTRMTGTIWCPVTANQTWLARRNGTTYYTGNTAWQTSDDAITTQIKPLLARIADASTTGYLRGALDELGKDPQGFVFHFDTAALTTKPNRSADALTFYKEGLISGSATVREGAFTEEDRPDEEEAKRRLAERAVTGAPTLMRDPALREILGLPPLPPELEAGAPPPTQQPAPQTPAPVKDPESPPEQTPQTEEGAALVAVSNLAMRRALALAGGRLVPHRQRDRYEGTDRHQLHTRFGSVSRDRAEIELRGAWADLPAVAEDLHVDPAQLEALLHGFAVELLTRGMAYDARLLRELVVAAERGRRLNALAEVAA